MSCCPSFLLGGTGAHLSIHGAVLNDKFIVQHLTDVYVGEATTYEDTRAYHIAKVFTSLRRARETLDEYYKGILNPIAVTAPAAPADDPPVTAPTTPADGSPVITPTTPADDHTVTTSTSPADAYPLPCFFPYPTRFKEYLAGTDREPKFTEFEYIDVPDADAANVTFFAKVRSGSPDRELVVKFVDRYGMEAHELLAREGMAPRLLYYGSLDGTNDVRNSAGRGEGGLEYGLYVGPLRMVVMDRIVCVQKRGSWPRDARDQVEEAIKKLHEKQLVFGDLREPNVLFSEGKVFLIDFDWAGKVGEARYPRGLSPHVDWPAQATNLERELIKPAHDLYMLNKLLPK